MFTIFNDFITTWKSVAFDSVFLSARQAKIRLLSPQLKSGHSKTLKCLAVVHIIA